MGEPLVEYSFFIPVCRDKEISDGAPHQLEIWDRFANGLFEHLGGWTQAPGLYASMWKSPQGTPIPDQSYRFIIALRTEQLDLLRQLLVNACHLFHQQAIYLSIGGQVEFITRSSDDSAV
jgi:hypothetical protein